MGSTAQLMAEGQPSACCICGEWGGWQEALFLIHKKMSFSLGALLNPEALCWLSSELGGLLPCLDSFLL